MNEVLVPHEALLVFALSISSALATTPMAAASGSIAGTVKDDRGKAIADAQILIINKISGYKQNTRSDAQGRFTLFNLPYNDYHLEVSASGLAGAHRDFDIRSNLPVVIDFILKPLGVEVAIEEKISLIEDHASSHLDIDKSTIEKSPAAVASRAMESILLTTPGFVADENGRFHFKGSHGQMMFVIDGVPVTDQVQNTFSNSLDPSQVESLEVITGGISAEYGGKPVGVVNLTSKSGLGTPGGFKGDLTLGASRFKTFEFGVGVRGGSDRFGYFVTGAASRSDRFLDPVNFENLHNSGSTVRLFSRFDWVLTDTDSLKLSISGGRTKRDVVNLASQQSANQDQRAENLDANLSLGWTHYFDAARSLDGSIFYRHANAQLNPSDNLNPGFGPGVYRDTPFWVKQDRNLDNVGAQFTYTQKFGEQTLKLGVAHVSYPIKEHFRFAATSDAAIDSVQQPNLVPYTPSGGGSIFTFQEKIKPSLSSAFVQTDWHLGPWFIAAGLRFDRYRVNTFSESELQPRLGVSYRVDATKTVFRVSYDRLLVTPENENLALSLSQQAWNLGPKAGTPAPPLKPELQNSYSYGVEQQLGKIARVSVEYWEKKTQNAADNEQFLNTGILFPVAAQRGLFRGYNVRLDSVALKGFSGYLSFGKTRAIFEAPLTGGLQLEAPKATPGQRFLIDHDQKLSAQLGLRFERNAFYAQVVGRFDSGLVAGNPADAAGNPDLEFGIPYIRQDSEGIFRIKARTTWNLSAGYEHKLSDKRSLVYSADLLNATDENGLYNFLSVFGGTHVIPPRTFAGRIKFRF
jgi:Carboxypeptidase regulatory-like domain/TonB-dependent Receptor Plug Domain